MLLKHSLIIGFLTICSFVNAQNADNNYSLGVNFLKNEYNGDYGNGIFNFNQLLYPALGLSLTKYLTSSFDAGFQTSYGYYGYRESEVNRFTGMKFDASLFAHYKFNNGYIFKEDLKLTPFISVGAGIATYGLNLMLDKSATSASYAPTIITKGVDLIIPLGVGLKYQLTDFLSIQYQYLYHFTSCDHHDENRGASNFGSVDHPYFKPGNDAYGQHVVGFIFLFNEPESLNNCRCNFN